ncbi:class I SAM-dependent methyltransferase [Streptomyces lunaelactis]|uniref:SAM-dependent methyltransferase n=1 Tax=Streptomyces lunaelactis TaxID=1535768 RepID=UPI0015849B81|nr:cyclopropane-fatty-acyl-phospholipid synthase family protein [Streptomyces lunaelactis]NUK10377.1 class I SAM-dependent methyltransferase [Streptomyces lunaelactis]NUK37265.1 class I SAM-dependent methyltransferase [Streptomyces lunaelactis]NUK44921.1 class I SAM-dependent methyltransferase [Streptomyces lunaelactis]NUK60443.1 class I SAM-dependent methyltransferase [Streptomyces lunaelactis]NUK94713.1 class I SAM-dependent methyltransferase [Streptomyces lunaelactis]
MSVSVSPASSRAASVDPWNWPDVARLPHTSRLRTVAAERLVRHTLGRLPLRVRFGGGEPIGLGGPLMEVHDLQAFIRRIGAAGPIGLGESYMAGEWEARDLVRVLTVLAEHEATLFPAPLRRRRGTWTPRRQAGHRRGPERSGDNVRRHCARSSELSALFLDETLSYSSALFRGFPAERNLLPAAQHRKIDRLLDLAQVGSGTQLLEIGTGWGELAIRAGQRGARVLTVTLSREQQALAQRRVREAGLEGRVTVLLREYGKVLGRYDAIVSVETIETVAEERRPEYFMMLDRLLVPGGRIALQTITMPHERLPEARTAFAWIQKYIPSAALPPSAEAIEQLVHGCTGLRVAACDGFGPHYAETLRLWRQRFTQRAAEVTALGLDETFHRMWTFYLARTEAGFRAGHLDVGQLLLTKDQMAA